MVFKSQSATGRRGAVAVEAALVLPVLVIVTLGAIDIAQYVNLSQRVTNASREGARMISRTGVDSTKDVEQAVRNYLKDSYPHLTDAKVAAATKIAIRDKANRPVPGGDLTNIPSGDQVSMDVAFDFSAVRWLQGPNWSASQCRTVCRRD